MKKEKNKINAFMCQQYAEIRVQFSDISKTTELIPIKVWKQEVLVQNALKMAMSKEGVMYDRLPYKDTDLMLYRKCYFDFH